MPSRLTSKLELHREAQCVTYRFEGCDLNVGDPLEIWTTLGWVRGVFTWEGESHLPYVSPPTKSGVLEPFMIVNNSVCRRPQSQQPLEANPK
jgi:hypothetical protein